ncbi:YhgE/Pip domain-containing protein [Mumia sp. ZJ430]|uniref:YhgE/Pip domain-containing protein n=1 Tax=Mumia sp. ZJ430 TaxID=2708083 RepID=UPI00141DBAD0|nr:YhgE/Pip domain-containing protein [Mumia sp. ZJ430]
MFAAFSPGSDLKRYYRGRMPRLALVVIVAMPLLYGALYLWAFWNPFAAADKIPVALINDDVGAVVQGEKLDAGKQVADGLIASKQLDLHLVSAKEGADGVADGTYYFSVTLPKDFSEAVASPAGDKPRSADLIFTYNDVNNYLATIIGQDAAQQAVNEISAQVGVKTFEIALNEVTNDLVPKVKEASSGATQLDTGLVKLNSGAQELSTKMVTAKDGSAELASGVDELDAKVDSVTGVLLAEIDKSGITGAEIRTTANQLKVNANEVVKVLDDVTSAQAVASQRLDTVVAQLRASGDAAERRLANALSPVQDALATKGLGPRANDQLTAIRGDARLLDSELGNSQSRISGALRVLESGEVVSQIKTARTDVGKLKSGADELSSGLVKLSSGADQLSAGTKTASAGSAELASGLKQGVGMIPSWSDEQRSDIAKALAKPVQLQEDYLHKAPTFGTGFAPFFFGLALFVGGIIAWMLFTPLQTRPLVQGLGSFRVVLASYAPTYAIGVLQAGLLYAVVVFAIGLRPTHPWATFGFMLLIVAMFLAMIQMFNALFGPAVGRVVTLAFLMIQLVSAGGIYPVPTTTKPFQYIHVIDPMTYTVTGLRQLTVGGIDSRLWVSITVIVCLTVLFLAVSTWAARRNRQYTMDRLYPPIEV